MGELARFGVSLEQDLLEAFDSLCARRAVKRSEAAGLPDAHPRGI